MSAISSIEWTDRTWNPVRGCSIVSPGCINCYAMKQAHRFSGDGKPYEGLTKQTSAGPQWTGKVSLIESALVEPLRWKKPLRIFVNSMSDLFHEAVPDEFILRVFEVMERARQHTFQILTKRPDRMLEVLGGTSGAGLSAPPLPNVWLGVSAEDQQRAEERIPALLQTPAAVRFLSLEPLLGGIDLEPLQCDMCGGFDVHQEGDSQPWCVECDHEMGVAPWLDVEGIDWVIVGGESGPGARPCDVAGVLSIVQQCKASGVAAFVKQVGAVPRLTGPCSLDEWTNPCTVTAASGGTHIVLKDRKGGDPLEWPESYRVREFPQEASR